MNPFGYQTYVVFEDPLVASAAEDFAQCLLPDLPKKIANFVSIASSSFVADLTLQVPDTLGNIKGAFTTTEFSGSIPEDCEIPNLPEFEGVVSASSLGPFVPFDIEAAKQTMIVNDATFQVPIPYIGAESEMDISNTLYANGESEYNFYVPRYENKVFFSSTPENLLPHGPTTRILTETENDNDVMAQHISLGGAVDAKGAFFSSPKLEDKASLEGHLKPFNLLTSPLGQYYDLYAGQFQEVLKCEVGVEINTRYENLIYSLFDAQKWLDRSANRFRHPMYLGIEFNTAERGPFAASLEKTGMFDLLMSDVAYYISNGISEILNVGSIVDGGAGDQVQAFAPIGLFGADVTPIEGPEGPIAPITPPPSPGTANRKWDVEAWLNSHIDEGDAIGEQDNVVFMSDKYEDNGGYRDKTFKGIYAHIVKDEMEEIENNERRTFDEVVESAPAYSEILFYRIAKYKGTNITTAKPIQSVFIPNVLSLKKASYFDTQVKWAQEYTYVVYAYSFVLGSEGHIEYLLGPGGEVLDVDIANSSIDTTAVIIETPYFVHTAAVYDDPPVAPNVTVYPYQNNDSEFLINVNSGIGTFRAAPAALLEGEKEIFKKILLRQKSKDGLVEYSSDDPASQYQLFVTDVQPNSLEEMVDSATITTATIQTDKDGIPIIASYAFLQKVKPNKKYYIMVRSIDVHLNPSQPSDIFEVEIIKDSGVSYFEMRAFEFANPIDEPYVRTATRRLKLSLAPLQQQVNNEKADAPIVPAGSTDGTLVGMAAGIKNSLTGKSKAELDPDGWIFDLANPKVALGPTSEMDSAWGQKYKLRLRSKETGRVIDFNFIFDYKHEKDYNFFDGDL